MRYLNEQIGEDYKGWGSDEVVLISTPTGSGKTTFVLQQLWSYARERREQMLFISNRRAITQQVKCKILEMYGLPEERMEEAEEVYEFDFLTVISYQKIEEKLLRGRLSIGTVPMSGFRYVVCDEIHYLLADSLFNSRTGILNPNLYFKAATRIYMSATITEVRDYIFQKEHLCTNVVTGDCDYIETWRGKRIVREYTAPLDYGYVHPWFINALDEVVEVINNEWKEDVPDRWIIWVNNKAEGTEIKRKLLCPSVFLMSESATGMTNAAKKTWVSITKREFFEQKVLICTKVLDCGVTLRDPLLKNMVLTATDEDEFKQMLGRKRVSNSGEALNLFLLPRSKSFFMGQLKHQFEPKRQIMRTLEKDGEAGLLRWMIENDADVAKQGTILLKPCMKFKINDAAKYAVTRHINWIYEMLSEFEAGGDNIFLKRQLAWLRLDFASGKWLKEQGRSRYEDELREWLAIQENTLLGKDDWRHAREVLRDYAFRCKGLQMNPEHPKRVPEISKVQQFLSDYGYEVVKAGVGRWKICRKKEN